VSLSNQVTQLLHDWSGGEAEALDKLVPLVYDELHRLARRYMASEKLGDTLQTTALVNEAYLRLVASGQTDWRDRAYFFGACAQIMRRILVDSARSRLTWKRGGDSRPADLKENLMAPSGARMDLAALDDALASLAAIDPRRARVVELRFFAGLSVEQSAEVLSISAQTVMRDWKLARSWLKRELTREGAGGP
jgi:RNA polymerase sigma factor (TIGR02999 family)